MHEATKDMPRFDLRQKRRLNPRQTDLEVFTALDAEDPWVDAQLPSLFLYLYRNPKLSIPPTWLTAMQLMKDEMENYVPLTQC